MILAQTVTPQYTLRRTDGQTDGQTDMLVGRAHLMLRIVGLKMHEFLDEKKKQKDQIKCIIRLKISNEKQTSEQDAGTTIKLHIIEQWQLIFFVKTVANQITTTSALRAKYTY